MDRPRVVRRWWLRRLVSMRLRTAIIFVLIFGGGFGWVVHRARVQRDAVAAIKAVGGEVWYDWQISGGPGKDSRPKWRRWLGDRLGTDFFEDVVRVYLGLRSKDAGMESVGRLDRLEHLIVGDQLSDAGLVHLRGLTRLKYLYLESHAITGAGLKNLEGLTRLERLDFCFVPVDDAGLAHLKGLSSLKSLTIPGGDRVTDAGLAHLEGLSSLDGLYITDSLISDAGLASVARLPRLKDLKLSGSKITDAGLNRLPRLLNLESLAVERTQVTDAGIRALRQSSQGIRKVDR